MIAEPSSSVDLDLLDRLSREVRLEVIQMSHRAESAHLGGALSCVDLLVNLYWTTLNIVAGTPNDPHRDRLIFSKGHAVSALYAVLAKKGFFPAERLLRYNQPGHHLPEQPSPGCAPGVEWATGSLGHGLGVASGLALAAKIKGMSYQTYALLSDGECQEGSTWEGAMLAPRAGLDNLTVLVDFNKWQATGRSNEVMAMESLSAKWIAFGWEGIDVNGHDHAQISEALQRPRVSGTPRAIIAHTVKGRGVSFMEDDNNWHYRSPTAAEVERAKFELGLL